MRSKLLALSIVLQILDGHLPIFVDPSSVIISSSSEERTPFLHACKQYLCLSLSRNAVSPVNQVFEICMEIFWRVLMGMRTKLKVRGEDACEVQSSLLSLLRYRKKLKSS